MTFYEKRVFVRPGVEEEEITPPCVKSRSFDSLSVAHILQGKLQDPSPHSSAENSCPHEGQDSGFKVPYAPGEKARPGSPDSPGSPTMAAAAALLSGVGVQHQPSVGMDSAVDCLMNLASAASSVDSAVPAPPSSGGKSSKRAASVRQAQENNGSNPRRRLKMRGNAPTQPRGSKAAAAAAAHAAAAASAAEPNTLCVAGIERPVAILSGASLQQLKLLAAAFKLCPTPTAEQLVAVARHVGVSAGQLETWFQSRRTLQEWVLQQPHMAAEDLARMFYPEATPQPVGDELPVAPAAYESPMYAGAGAPPWPQTSTSSAADVWPAGGGGAYTTYS